MTDMNQTNFKALFRFSQKQVDAAFQSARPFASCYGIKVLRGAQRDDVAHGTFLLVPTKKIKTAVQRNLLKRRLKALIYEHELGAQTGTFIFLLYPAACEIMFDKLKAFIATSFS